MKPVLYILFAVFLFANALRANVSATDSLQVQVDSAKVMNVLSESKQIKKLKEAAKTDSVKSFKPDPVRVVWMGAIIPGYGQIINRSYWKLPVVYAGFLACGYAITHNSTKYENYKQAYKDISDTNDKTNSFMDLLPAGYSVDNFPGGRTGLQNNLKSFYDQYRRYRDLSIIATIGYYAITIVEAYVDAQLFDFDISTDLSMHVRPSLLQNAYGRSNTPGLQVSLSLK